MLTGTSGKIELNLGILVLILLLVLFIKTYLESTNYEGFYTNTTTNIKSSNIKSSNMKGDRLLSKIIFETNFFSFTADLDIELNTDGSLIKNMCPSI